MSNYGIILVIICHTIKYNKMSNQNQGQNQNQNQNNTDVHLNRVSLFTYLRCKIILKQQN